MMTERSFFNSPLSKKEFKSRESAQIKALQQVCATANIRGDALIRHQEMRMKQLIRYAWKRIPFYRSLYQEAGFDPDQFNTLGDLQKVPVVTKSMLRSAERFALQPAELEGTRFLSTSGSTGEPVGLYKSDQALWLFMASAFYRYHQWCGETPIRNVLYILDGNPHNIDYVLGDFLRTFTMEDRFVSAFAGVDVIWEAVDICQPEYISTYPSVARNLALYSKTRGWTFPRVKILNLTSEMLDAQTKNLIHRVFPNGRIIETYTSTEVGFMGYQCMDKGGFHLTEDMGIYEVLPLKGHPGSFQLTVTDFFNFATPIIRYEGLNDIVSVAVEPCKCGSGHLRIRNIQGRVVDSVIMPDGTRITPYVLTNIVSEIPGIHKYQIIQREPSTFLVKVVMDGIGNRSAADLEIELALAFQDALKGKIRVCVQEVEDILPKPGQHKIPLVLSQIESL